MKAPVTFAIAGFGDRGSTYASMQNLFPDKMKVVAVADLNPAKVEKAKKLYDIPEEHCFSSAEEMLAQPRLADVMVVSTMDRQHVGHAIPALEKGYHILLEKPISPELLPVQEDPGRGQDLPREGHRVPRIALHRVLQHLEGPDPERPHRRRGDHLRQRERGLLAPGPLLRPGQLA